MSPRLLNDLQRWRDHADEMRLLAVETSDPESRMTPGMRRSRGGQSAKQLEDRDRH